MAWRSTPILALFTGALATSVVAASFAAMLSGSASPAALGSDEEAWARAAFDALALAPEAEAQVRLSAPLALRQARAVEDSSRRAALLENAFARLAVAVVQEPGGPLPSLGGALCVRFVGAAPPEAFAEGLGENVEMLPLRDAPPAADCGLVAVTVASGARPDASDADAIRALASSAAPLALVALGPPSLADGLPRPDAFVATHSAHPAAQRAAADAILGRIPVSGRLAGRVRGLYPKASGVDIAQQVLREDTPEAAGMAPDVAEAIDAVIEQGVASGAFPGAAVAVGRGGVLLRLRGYGALTPGGAAVTPDTPYDLASLTKVVATTALAMRATERGDLDLDAPVSRYVPAYQPVGGADATIRHLLTHTAGQRPFYPFFAHGMTPEAARDFIHRDTLARRPGERIVYSDFDMIVLGEALESASGAPLDQLVRDEITGPLGMAATGFRPTGTVDPLAAPTEVDTTWRMRTLQGEVHDEAASLLGGVAGHAGLFSTARDMARFGFTLTQGGSAYGYDLVAPATLARFTERVRTPGTWTMGLGWMRAPEARDESDSMGRLMGPKTYGHTGFTGTSIWIDPDEELFVVLLTNRVHPTRANTKIRAVRAALADAVAGRIVAPVH